MPFWALWVTRPRETKFPKLSLIELGFPRPQTGARTPVSWKRGFRGPKTPISPHPCKGWKREFSVQKSPFSMCSPVEKRGFFDRKLLFSERGEMGVFGPRNPLFQKTGIRAPVWGRGNPNHRVPEGDGTEGGAILLHVCC